MRGPPLRTLPHVQLKAYLQTAHPGLDKCLLPNATAELLFAQVEENEPLAELFKDVPLEVQAQLIGLKLLIKSLLKASGKVTVAAKLAEQKRVQKAVPSPTPSSTRTTPRRCSLRRSCTPRSPTARSSYPCMSYMHDAGQCGSVPLSVTDATHAACSGRELIALGGVRDVHALACSSSLVVCTRVTKPCGADSCAAHSCYNYTRKQVGSVRKHECLQSRLLHQLLQVLPYWQSYEPAP